MKNVLVFSVFLFVCLTACQKEENEMKSYPEDSSAFNHYGVDISKAIQIASEYSYADIGKKEGTVTKSLLPKTISSYKTEVNELGENILHIINYEEGGFVIIAADQRLYPVLAYSDSNHFPLEDNYSPGVNLWIEEMDQVTQMVQETIEEPTDHLLKLWAEVSRDEVTLRNIRPDPRCEYAGQPVSGNTRVDTYGYYTRTLWDKVQVITIY